MSAIDVNEEADSGFQRLLAFKPQAGVEFYKLKTPSGKEKYGYRIEFVSDVTTRMNTRFPNEDGSPKPELIGTVKFLTVWFDSEIKVGEVRRINLSRHAACANWFKEHLTSIEGQPGSYHAKGLIYEIMIQGKVKGKRNRYWAYAIIPAGAEAGEGLLDAIVVEPEGSWTLERAG